MVEVAKATRGLQSLKYFSGKFCKSSVQKGGQPHSQHMISFLDHLDQGQGNCRKENLAKSDPDTKELLIKAFINIFPCVASTLLVVSPVDIVSQF